MPRWEDWSTREHFTLFYEVFTLRKHSCDRLTSIMINMREMLMTPEVQFFPAQNEERKLKLMLRASIVEDVLLLHCSGRVTFCDEADVLLAKVCVLMPHTRQLVLSR